MFRDSRAKYRRFSMTGTATVDDTEETSRDQAIGDDWINLNRHRSMESPALPGEGALASPYALNRYISNGTNATTNGTTNGYLHSPYASNVITEEFLTKPVSRIDPSRTGLETTDHSGSFSSLNPCGCNTCQRILDFLANTFAAGSIWGAVFNMCIATVGAGALALPYAVRNVGLILGFVGILFAAFWSYFTLDLLLISAEYLPDELKGTGPLRNISYQTYVGYVSCILLIDPSCSLEKRVTICHSIEIDNDVIM